ncbi:putative ABC transporter peptide-binding protein YtcQ [Spirochaetia bacterium]|nr:putative ABC transporter peptide-binding protein YtcQ [Spirochaetia bacterium]
MKGNVQKIAGILMLLGLISIFVGCKGKEASVSSASGPFRITIMNRTSTAEPPAADNAVIKEIERITNTKLDITWSSQAAYPEKLSVTIASGDYPMLTLFEGGGKPSTAEIECVRAGLFWKVGDYVKDPQYKWLQELDDARIQNASIDGELWGMYRTRPAVRNGLYYRKDWAEKLGLDKPKNIDDLYNMVKAFVKDDPDGNGKNDTFGIGQEAYLRLVFGALSPSFGIGNAWDVVDGKLAAVHVEQGYFDMLKYIKRFYDEGLINRDFPTVTEDRRNELLADNYGMAITSIDKGRQSIVPLQKLHPGADFVVMTDLPDVHKLIARTGFDSKYYISKKAVPNEADVKKIIKFFDDMHSPEINNLIYNGIEGVHYTKVGANEITISSEQKAKYNLEVEPVSQLGFQFLKNNYVIAGNSFLEEQIDYFYNKYDVPLINDPTQTFISETQAQKGSQLEQFIWDSGVQYITGAIDEKGWWAAVDRWRRDGGDAMTAEYQAQYDKVKK